MATISNNNSIKETTLKLIKLISKEIENDLMDNSGSVIDQDKLFDTMLKAYNMWQEDTHDGVDYIFDINNKQDTICLLQGDLKVSDISSLYINQFNQNNTPYFVYGVNYEKPKVFKSMQEVKIQLADNTEWIMTHLFLFANKTDIYQTLFDRYVGELFNA